MVKEKSSPVHIRLNYDEAKDSRKDLLSSEINLLQIIKRIQNYQELRMKELEIKQDVLIKMGEVRKNIMGLEKVLPKLKLPKILKKKENFEIKEESMRPVMRRRRGLSIQDELLEIQSKLRELEN